MLNIVLYEPEIPPNTGNIIRLCANTGCRLHLIEPLGFSFEDKQLRRAGLDYHEFSQVQRHGSWPAFRVNLAAEARIVAFSTKGRQPYSTFAFQEEDYLLFGPESRGLPDALLAAPEIQQVLRLPMLPQSRSLNLSNTVAVVVYEAWRQLDFLGGV